MLHEPARDSEGQRKSAGGNRGYRVTAHYRLAFSALVATRLVSGISSPSYPIVFNIPPRLLREVGAIQVRSATFREAPVASYWGYQE